MESPSLTGCSHWRGLTAGLKPRPFKTGTKESRNRVSGCLYKTPLDLAGLSRWRLRQEFQRRILTTP
jgi:hypothetical protein